MRERVPCGACRALVPADRGCRHWRPRNRVRNPKWAEQEAQAKRNAAEAVAAFRRMMRLGSS